MTDGRVIGQATLILDVEVAGIEQNKFGEAIFVELELLTKCSPWRLLRASAGFSFHENDDGAKLDDFLARCHVGSCFRARTNDFHIDEDRLHLSAPDLMPLDAFESGLLGKQLRDHECIKAVGSHHACPDRLLPEALTPVLKTLIGIACGKLLTEFMTRDVRDFMLADSRHWYSLRLEGQIAQVSALLDRAVTSIVEMVGPDRQLRELMVHIAAPVSAEMTCLINVSERLRAVVGEGARIFVSTTMSAEETCNIGLLGRV
mgnify:CR=1 FL=1